jgi:Rrf2 family protein
VQILQQLRAAGLVFSTRGSSGGFQLNRPPNQITLGEIVDAVHPTPTIPAASEGDSAIQLAVHQLWEELARNEQRFLQSITLSGLVDRVQGMPSTMFFI